MTTVRYIVDDVAEAVDFHVSKLGFEVEFQVPGFATVAHEDLTLWLAGRRSVMSVGVHCPGIPSPRTVQGVAS